MSHVDKTEDHVSKLHREYQDHWCKYAEAMERGEESVKVHVTMFMWVLTDVCMSVCVCLRGKKRVGNGICPLSTERKLLCSHAIFTIDLELCVCISIFVAVMHRVRVCVCVCVCVRVVCDLGRRGCVSQCVSICLCEHFMRVPLRSVCRMCHVHVYFVQPLRIIPA